MERCPNLQSVTHSLLASLYLVSVLHSVNGMLHRFYCQESVTESFPFFLVGLIPPQVEGIFRINAENGHAKHVWDQLNKGIVPVDIDVHCLAGLIKVVVTGFFFIFTFVNVCAPWE